MYFPKKLLQRFKILFMVLVAVMFFIITPAVNASEVNSLDNFAAEFVYDDYTINGFQNSEYSVGSYAFYVFNQAGIDVNSWLYDDETFEESVTNAIYTDILNEPEKSAKLLAQDLAAAKVLNQNDYAGQLVDIFVYRQTVNGFDDSLFSNIPAFELIGAVGLIDELDTGMTKEYILGQQSTTVDNDVYSWGFTYGEYYPDFITTAKAIRALHYLDPGQSDPEIQEAIDNGLAWMQNQQQDDGSFIAGYPGMDDPLIDTAELIMTLAALDMDLESWTSIAGNSAVDYLLNNALNEDGSFGQSQNVLDAVIFINAYSLVDNGLYIYPSDTTMDVGDNEQLKAFWKNADGTNDVTCVAEWSVIDSSIVSVYSDGAVSALETGQTTVQAVYGGLTASAAINVESLSSGDSPGSGSTSTEVEVAMAIVDGDGNILFAPSEFTVDDDNEWGLTILGALDASGASYTTAEWDWGNYVDSVQGLAATGSSGWMFALNGQQATTGAEDQSIEDGDQIIWYYVSSMDAQPPEWSDLVRSSSGDSRVSVEESDTVSDTDLNTAIQSSESTGQIVLELEDTKTTLALSNDQITKILKTGKPLVVNVNEMQFVFPAETLKLAEITGENVKQLIIDAEKLSDWKIQTEIKPFYNEKLKPAGNIYELNVMVVDTNDQQQAIKQVSGCRITLQVAEGYREIAQTGMVQAYHYNETSEKWEFLGGAYDTQTNTISFYTDHFSKYALLVATASFDDIDGHWAQKEIEIMAANGYVTGMCNGIFSADNHISRAEFVTVLTRIAGLTANPVGTVQFSDVPANAWYRDAVNAAVYNGIVYGVSADRFAPGELIMREQMAAMIERLLAKKNMNCSISDNKVNKVLGSFTDTARIHSWALRPVALAAQEKLMNGRGNGQFVPQGNATRAEATVVLYRVLQKFVLYSAT
ncbi:S-layer homology domain-containing protein [Phosphitispora sp. TUW77]|uniref:S-layer homology domain-containing protein n=1 Tax=Phosphitispora sp. TUW77 TaxID=3152361 RepID=UPI003AB4CDED